VLKPSTEAEPSSVDERNERRPNWLHIDHRHIIIIITRRHTDTDTHTDRGTQDEEEQGQTDIGGAATGDVEREVLNCLHPNGFKLCTAGLDTPVNHLLCVCSK